MKNILLIVNALLFVCSASAQAKFNLRYNDATQTYTVSIIPETTWTAPKNMVSSAQIVLRVDADKEFTPGISSLIPGLTWADNAYVEQPAGAEAYMFVCISLENGPTKEIAMKEGEEVPLFSFINAGGTCAGKVAMLANDEPMVQAVRAAGFNVTQHLAVLGARGNAFSGFENSEVDCTAASGAQEQGGKIIDAVGIAPVPSDKSVRIEWNMLSIPQGQQQILICDARGREVFRDKISEGLGAHSLNLNVENWQAGLYKVRFLFENGRQTQSWSLMVIH